MIPRMKASELALFKSLIMNKKTYVEFGSGGSTYVASQTIQTSIISLDSSQEWLNKIDSECKLANVKTHPKLLHIDIGPIKAWGYPSDKSCRDRWPDYYNSVWKQEHSENADVYFVDGRFRVACFLTSLLHCRPDSVFLIHDFSKRIHYHVVKDFAFQIAECDSMAAFVPRATVDIFRLRQILEEFKYIAD